MVVVLLLKAISTKQKANFAVIHQPSPQGEALKNFFCILKFTVSIVPTNTQSEVVIKLFTVHFAD